jgi:chromosome segregation ATPase
MIAFYDNLRGAIDVNFESRSATIVVRIKNQGDSAYLPNEFGGSIIVERHFTKSGASGFRIKSAAGRTISTKKTDLDSITDYFTLQIDNPMNVLSQDMARQFLSTSSPAEKYKFFVKGVQLEQLDHDYRLIEESIDQVEEKLTIHLDEMKALDIKKDRANAKLAMSDRHESLRDKLRNLRAQMAWAQVEEQERVSHLGPPNVQLSSLREQIRDSLDDELETAGQRIAKAESDIEKLDEIFQDAERACEDASQAARQARLELEHVQDQRKSIKDLFDESVNERHDLQVCTIYVKISMCTQVDLLNLGPTTLHTRTFEGCRISHQSYSTRDS